MVTPVQSSSSLQYPNYFCWKMIHALCIVTKIILSIFSLLLLPFKHYTLKNKNHQIHTDKFSMCLMAVMYLIICGPLDQRQYLRPTFCIHPKLSSVIMNWTDRTCFEFMISILYAIFQPCGFWIFLSFSFFFQLSVFSRLSGQYMMVLWWNNQTN